MTTRKTRASAVIATAAMMVATAGCSSDPTPAATTTAAATATRPQAAPPSPAPTPTGPAKTPRSSTAGTPTPATTTTLTTLVTPRPSVTRSLPRNQISIDGQQVARTTAAAAAATRFMQAFARPDLSEAAWWARVGPLLTASGREAAYGTDPSLIPVTTLTGEATVLPNAEKDARIVTVPTDIGDYTLFLLWDRATSRWLVETAQPPDGVK